MAHFRPPVDPLTNACGEALDKLYKFVTEVLSLLTRVGDDEDVCESEEKGLYYRGLGSW